MNVYEANLRVLLREQRICALLPTLAADLRSSGLTNPWSVANQIAEALVDAEAE